MKRKNNKLKKYHVYAVLKDNSPINFHMAGYGFSVFHALIGLLIKQLKLGDPIKTTYNKDQELTIYYRYDNEDFKGWIKLIKIDEWVCRYKVILNGYPDGFLDISWERHKN